MIMEKYYKARCCGIVDLKSQKESVQEYLRLNGKNNIPVLYLNDEEKDFQELSYKTKARLCKIVQELGINKIIISTEPKAHTAYIKWAIKEKLDFIVDKPIFTETYENVLKKGKSQLYEKYILASEKIEDNGVIASVMMPRRLHPAIMYIHDYLLHFICNYKVPITHINIIHGEGMWNMPNEFFTRENHPYKYGYGAYFHTGYHFIDLLCHFLSINKNIEKENYDKIQFALSYTRPKDICRIFGEDSYNRLIDVHNLNSFVDKMDKMGEVDWQLIVNFCKDGIVCASGNLDMQQSNYSARNSKLLPKDVYKDNGRIYHEFISIEVAHLLSIKLMRMTIGNQPHKEKYNNKQENFVIQVFRNQNIVGGKAFKKL